MTEPVDRKFPGAAFPPPENLATCHRVRLKVPVHQIDYVCRLLEGHEDLCIARTENGTSDILELWVPEGMVADVLEWISAVSDHGLVEMVSPPSPMSAGWPSGPVW